MPDGSYRSQTKAQARREQVAVLYCQGRYQTEIARQLGVTQQQISLDLQILRQKWLASALRDFDAAKAQELQKLDVLEREAWEAWERSKAPREVTLTEQIETEALPLPNGTLRPPRPVTRKASVRREAGYGDVRFLDQIQKCIQHRSLLLGLVSTTDALSQATTGLASLLEAARTGLVGPVPSAVVPPAAIAEA
jgi:hypothetical protein